MRAKQLQLAITFQHLLIKKNQKLALNQRMKVFKGTGMVRILTCAAQKLHSETKPPFGLSKEPMHLLTCRKQKKEEKHGIC